MKDLKDRFEADKEYKKFFDADLDDKDNVLTLEEWKPLATEIYDNITDE